MKKILCGFMVIIFGLFFAGAVQAAAVYEVVVTEETGSLIWADEEQDSIPEGLFASLPTDSAFANLNDEALLGMSWNAAGYFAFDVSSSTTEAWNEVFAGGNYYFSSTWSGGGFTADFLIPDAIPFSDVYGQWVENNPSCYTYFGLVVNPTSGGASDGSVSPVGYFAFVARDDDDNDTDFDFATLYTAIQGNGGNPLELTGEGTITAAVPIPGAVWLLGSGLAGIAGLRRRFFK